MYEFLLLLPSRPFRIRTYWVSKQPLLVYLFLGTNHAHWPTNYQVDARTGILADESRLFLARVSIPWRNVNV